MDEIVEEIPPVHHKHRDELQQNRRFDQDNGWLIQEAFHHGELSGKGISQQPFSPAETSQPTYKSLVSNVSAVGSNDDG